MSFLYLLLAFSLTDAPGPERLRFLHMSIEHGMSQNSIYSMTQDEHGFLWMGTQDGLNRWDGHQFMVFRRDTASPNSLSDNFIRALLIDSKNRLWVGTNNGLSLLRDNGFRNIYLPTGETTPAGNRIFCMAQDAKDRIWVGTGNGLLRFPSPAANDEPIHFDTFFQSDEDSSILGNAI